MLSVALNGLTFGSTLFHLKNFKSKRVLVMKTTTHWHVPFVKCYCCCLRKFCRKHAGQEIWFPLYFSGNSFEWKGQGRCYLTNVSMILINWKVKCLELDGIRFLKHLNFFWSNILLRSWIHLVRGMIHASVSCKGPYFHLKFNE